MFKVIWEKITHALRSSGMLYQASQSDSGYKSSSVSSLPSFSSSSSTSSPENGAASGSVWSPDGSPSSAAIFAILLLPLSSSSSSPVRASTLRVGPTELALGFAAVLFVSVASTIYPAMIATRVQPVVAMQTKE